MNTKFLHLTFKYNLPRYTLFFVTFFTIFSCTVTKAVNDIPEIQINEFMASNVSSLAVEADYLINYFPDWIELHNPTNNDLDIGGMFLTDNSTKLTKYQIPENTIVPAQGYLIFYADELKKEMGFPHLNFKLSASGEYIAIVDVDGISILDEIIFPEQYDNASYGKKNNMGTWQYIYSPTPGEKNIIASDTSDIQYYTSLDLYFNELIADNTKWAPTDWVTAFGAPLEQLDWFEIKNAENISIDLSGMYLTDDPNAHTKYKIKDGVIVDANSYHVFVAVTIANMDQQNLVDTFSLKSSGEYLGLYAPDGETLIDEVTFGPQQKDVSYGRMGDEDTWAFFQTPTIGAANPSAGMSKTPTIINPPELTTHIQDEPFFVTLKTESITPGNNVSIFYTTDGSEPTDKSAYYTDPIYISKTTLLRAVAKEKGGYTTSKIANRTYFFDFESTIPIVSVTAPFDYMTDENMLNKKDIPIFLEYFEPDGTHAFVLDGDIAQNGGNIGMGQGSFRFYAKEQYGVPFINYRIFKERNFDIFKRLLFRNGSQRGFNPMFKGSHLTDVLAAQIAKGTHAGWTAWEPVNVFLGGKYYGLYNLRERIDPYYVESNYGVDHNNVISSDEDTMYSPKYTTDKALIEEAQKDSQILANEPYFRAFLEDLLLEPHDLNSTDFTTFIDEHIDIDNLFDYMAVEMFIGNGDWPWNNVERWISTEPNGKFHWIIKDADISFGIYTNMFKYTFDRPNQSIKDTANKAYLTPLGIIMGRIMENETLRNKFINRFADLLNTQFTKEHTLGLLESAKEKIEPEIPKQIERWWNGWTKEDAYGVWNNSLNVLSTNLKKRPDNVRTQLIDYFPNVTGQHTLTIKPSGCGGTSGTVHINTLSLGPEQFPWVGTYFEGVPITVSVEPQPGINFTGWQDHPEFGLQTTLTIDLTENIALTPTFEREKPYLKNGDADDSTNNWILSEDGVISTISPDGEDYIFYMRKGGMSQIVDFGCEGTGIDTGILTANLSLESTLGLLGDNSNHANIYMTYINSEGTEIEKDALTISPNNKWNAHYFYTNNAGQPRPKVIPTGTRKIDVSINVFAGSKDQQTDIRTDDITLLIENKLETRLPIMPIVTPTTRPTIPNRIDSTVRKIIETGRKIREINTRVPIQRLP